jgi:hypothetical protein
MKEQMDKTKNNITELTESFLYDALEIFRDHIATEKTAKSLIDYIRSEKLIGKQVIIETNGGLTINGELVLYNGKTLIIKSKDRMLKVDIDAIESVFAN